MARKAAAKKTPAASKAGSAAKPAGAKGTTQKPEADAEASPVFRADMGEGLPPQKDTLNPNRAK